MKINSVSFGYPVILKNNINYGYKKPNQLKADTVSFGQKDVFLLSPQDGANAAKKLRNSTSGYRGELGKEFNDKFIYSLTSALGEYLKDNKINTVLIGGDTRKATSKYAPLIAGMLTSKGVDVVIPDIADYKDRGNFITPVATPVLACAAKEMNIPLAVLLTASHNPWSDGGYNFVTSEGAIADDKVIIPLADKLEKITKTRKYGNFSANVGKIKKFNPFDIYKKQISDNNLIDFDNIRNSNIRIAYEGLNGTGAYYFPEIMAENGVKLAKTMNTLTEGPEPKAANLQELAKAVKNLNGNLKIGLANDGDADRFGVVDENGNFISANDVIMLMAYHLIKNKGNKQGTIVINNATSDKIFALAEYLNKNLGADIQTVRTPVGFKYLGGEILKRENTDYPVILAGEESGGLTINGHIPEKDGIVAVSNIADLVATEHRNIGEILSDINEKLGKSYTTSCENIKFKSADVQNEAMESFRKYIDGSKSKFAGYDIDLAKTMEYDEKLREYKPAGDGIKILFDNGSSLLIRKSGTEPKLRIIPEGVNEKVYNDLKGAALEEVAKFK